VNYLHEAEKEAKQGGLFIRTQYVPSSGAVQNYKVYRRMRAPAKNVYLGSRITAKALYLLVRSLCGHRVLKQDEEEDETTES
jgi:hypothetical protein